MTKQNSRSPWGWKSQIPNGRDWDNATAYAIKKQCLYLIDTLVVFCHRHLLQSSNREIYWGTTMCQIQNSLGDEADGSIVCWRTNVSLMIWLCQAEVLPLTCCLHHGLAANLLVMTVLLLHRVVLFCWSHTFPNSFFGWGCLRCSGNHGKLCAPMHSCSLIWLLMMISTTLLWWGSHPTGPKASSWEW